ncbi:MAG: transglycosylase domain-containing protein [Rubrobacteraceae bacterium]
MHGGDLVRLSRRRRRQRQKKSFLAIIRNFLLLMCALTIIGFVGAFATFSYTYAQVAQEVPDLENYSSGELAETSVVYDNEGNVVDELYGTQNRYVVSLKDIDSTLEDAVIAIEDHRFYEHRGLDFEAIGRAAVENVKNLSIQEGGSTITQQLIKNTYIAQEERAIPSFQRKFTEASLAWQYEEERSKKEILEQYLNTVYFGANAYGAEAAAKTYYNKSADELTLAESAMLAGIINLPGAYDPFNDPESATARRNVVLDRMLESGYIDEKAYDRAVAQDLNLNRGRVEHENDNEYFLDAVRKELAKEYGDEMIYEGGLKIYTTLDPQLQEQASKSVEEILYDPNDPSSALVSVEPSTGAVKSMVGGTDFEQVKFNLATQGKRQSGSTFKPFVLAEAIHQGISPESRYVSQPLSIPMPADSLEPYYEVVNYEDEYRGPITVEKATKESDNAVYIQLAQDLGIENVVEMAKKLGVESEVDANLPTAIGGLREGVTPLEMASAYSTFANQGVHMEPFLVEKVVREAKGEEETLMDHKLKGERAISRDEAAAVNEVMSEVGNFYGMEEDLGRPVATKTGTSEEYSDAWFLGYVPQLTTSVWVGYPGDRVPMVWIRGYEKIDGGAFPMDIWKLYMQRAMQEYPEVQQFAPPSPGMNLKVKTDGRAYDPPATTSTNEEEEQTEEGGTTSSEEPDGPNSPDDAQPDEFQESQEQPGDDPQEPPPQQAQQPEQWAQPQPAPQPAQQQAPQPTPDNDDGFPGDDALNGNVFN